MAHVEESTASRGARPEADTVTESAAAAVSRGPANRLGQRGGRPDATMLAGEWRRLRQAATAVAIFTSPLFFVILYDRVGLPWPAALAATVGAVIAFRGFVDVTARRLLPWPRMYGVARSV